MGVKVRKYDNGSAYFFDIIWKGERLKKPAGEDQAVAEAAATLLEAKLKTGETTVAQLKYSGDKTGETPTFGEIAKVWLSLPHEWKPSTRDSYEFNLRKHILPKFGKLRIDEITRSMIRRFLDDKLVKGAAPAFVSLLKAPINGVMAQAVDYEYIPHNPAKDISVKKSKNTARHVNPLSEKQIPMLLEAAKKFVGGWYYPPLLCSLMTGLRFGELQALKWEDIDFETRIISIERIWYRGRFGTPKSGKSRKVDAPPHLIETLNALKLEQRKQSFRNGTGGKAFEFVFANHKGNMLDQCSYNNALKKCLKTAGLPKIRVHDLRHTYATVRILRGHNIADVSNQLGHRNIGITLDYYFHFVPGKFKSEIETLDTLIDPPKNPKTSRKRPEFSPAK
ncbi:integrase family protein [Desulfosarcina variabilis str. Montpellier]|uniref:tyrosine-type recombinase/integrase n=1 Tax=Desulfosarcina variabilis TaxID=2300 RepID=UPI003AFAE328